MKNRFLQAWTSNCYGFEYTDITGGGMWMPPPSRKGEFWNVNKHADVEDLLKKKNYFPVFQWELNHIDMLIKTASSSWETAEPVEKGRERD